MITSILNNLFRYVLLVLIQVFLLKNMLWYNFPIPHLYIIFILLLPFKTPNVLIFLLSFTLGITIDAFYDTPGFHAAACTLVGFVRISFINLVIAHKDSIDDKTEPTLSNMGFLWFFIYALVASLFYYSALFFLGIFHLSEVGYAFRQIVSNTLFTLLLIITWELLFSATKNIRHK